MAQAKFLTQCFIKINGQQVPDRFMADLEEVVVDTSLLLPDMFTIRVLDQELEWVDNSLFDIGNEVEISIETGEEQGSLRGVLIKGEITAWEPDFSSQGNTALLIRGYDKSHRLHRGRKTRTFLKQKDDALVRTIAGEVGLSPQVDATTVTFDYVLQNNQTNMEFLQARANRIGYQVYSAEGKLYFKKGEASLGEGPQLALGETLHQFRPSFSAVHQADKLVVKGWDAKGKQTITAEKTPNSSLNQGGMLKTGGDYAAVFGSAENVVTDQPVFSPDEATALATGLGNDINRDFVEAEGVCRGHPGVKPGWTVTIDNVGKRFKGKYFVTAATHVYSGDGYQTSFSITGRRPNTVSHLLDSTNGRDEGHGMMRGVVTGLVTNLNDPDNLGRVKVKYAWLGDVESDWVRIATPMGGPERGFYYLPEVNDEVLLAFEQGDIDHPYIVGYLWSNKDKPPKPTSEVVEGGTVNERIIKSRSGHTVVLDDSDGSEKIIIRDKTENNEIVIDSSNNSMTINVAGDFEVNADGKITLNSKRDMTLDSKAAGTFKTQSNMTVEATGNLTAEAKMNGTVKGLNLTLEGTTKSTLKGLTVGVEASTLAELKGALVKIN